MVCLSVASLSAVGTTHAQSVSAKENSAARSELRDLVHRYSTDRSALLRRWSIPYSPARAVRMRTFYRTWLRELAEVDSASRDVESRIDAILLKNQITYELALLDREEGLRTEILPLVPFADVITGLQESRHRMERVDGRDAAGQLRSMADQIDEIRDALTEERADHPSRVVALRTAEWIGALKKQLDDWYSHYAEYDPLFTWWTKEPKAEADEALTGYTGFLETDILGFREGEDPPIVGDPIGESGMQADLRHEMIPYTPAELVQIANAEFAWCERQMLEASRDLGYGEDWRAALEHVKGLHVDPGDQPELVRRLAQEAIDFLDRRDLLTIPPLAKEVWRMTMLSPEAQKVAPFFLGGEVVQVSYPTSEMSHDDKLMSMRGNNVHFSRAVVHHELIPGHHLQGFMNSRYNTHRRAFRTPFWTEGWALYWEMLLWDQGFPQSAEDRVGMLFWRMHRAARIIFSLSFHLGTMTPDEAIDFLVDRVGHERANATAEVRRSFNGSYPPLYQAAYMLGGLQFRALHSELVGTGRLTNREFHDSILRGGPMPVEMVRARLLNEPPGADFKSSWRFYGDPGR
jgi:uncharacterized protein (DUF885 family)